MRINNAEDLGSYVRDCRKSLGRSQADLAGDASVSRRFLIDLERGKPTAEIGLVLRVLRALRLVLDASPQPSPGIDLDEIIREHTGPIHGADDE